MAAANKAACVGELSLNTRPPEGNTKGNIGIPLHLRQFDPEDRVGVQPAAVGRRPSMSEGRPRRCTLPNPSGYCGKRQESRRGADERS